MFCKVLAIIFCVCVNFMVVAGNRQNGAYPLKLGVNVRDFGAVGDGKSDDTTALQKAFDEACRPSKNNNPSTKGPRVVYLPQGTYRITRSLFLTNKHRNIAIIGTGGSRNKAKYSTTQIKFDGKKGETLLECKPLSGLRMTDLLLDGNNKAGIVMRINSGDGHGTAEFFIERVCMRNADVGMELGADLAVCASDMTLIDLNIDHMKEAAFRSMSVQVLDFVFIRPEVGSTPIGFHFVKGGAATFIHPCAFRVGTLLKIDSGGISAGVFSVRGWFWERYSYKDEKSRMVFVNARGECNISISGVATGASRLWGKNADLKTPNFILSDGAQLKVTGSMICGKIARLTGKKDRTATFIQFDGCRFRCASNPKKDVDSDIYSGYEFRNCNVTIDDTTGEKYKILKNIFIPKFAKYPIQALGQPGYIAPNSTPNTKKD